VRIIQIIPSLDQESSGPTYSVTSLFKYLSKSFSVSLVSCTYSSFSNIKSSSQYIFKFLPFLKKLSFCPKLFDFLLFESKSYSSLVLHNHGMWQWNALYASFIKKKNPSILLVQSTRGSLSSWAFSSGSFLKPLFWFLFQRKALESVDLFHATSHQEYLDIRRYGFHQPVAIIPNGLNLIEKVTLTKSMTSNHKTLLYLGRLHPIKGLDVLLDSWKLITGVFPDWRLKIVGSDIDYHGCNGFKNTLMQKILDESIENVMFSEEVFGSEKFDTFASADLFVLPSRSENFGVTVGESLSVGTPVITTNNTPWILDEDNGGWTVNLTVNELKEALITSMSLDLSTLNHIGQNGRQYINNNFSWEIISSKMLCMYKYGLDPNSEIPDFFKIN